MPDPKTTAFLRTARQEPSIKPATLGTVLDPAISAIVAARAALLTIRAEHQRLPRDDRSAIEELNQKHGALERELERAQTQIQKCDRIAEEIERETPRIAEAVGVTDLDTPPER